MTAPETLAERLAKCVKPLEWEWSVFGDCWTAEPYRIERLGSSFRLYRIGVTKGIKSFRTLNAAQAAAQADYTARILAALDMDAIARLVAEAFSDGATAVHNEWVRAHGAGETPPRVADFSEAADDYAAAIRARAAQTEKEG